MPVVTANQLVLVTGSSGFLAAHICQQLLQRGFAVRGTVRSAEKGEYLRELYAKDGLKNFSYVIVEDVETPNAFDESVKGVDGIAHTASPFHFNVTDPKDLIDPAVNGTLNLLKSAIKEPMVRRVVITSSFAAILNPVTPVYNFTEADWNTHSPEQVTLLGPKTDGVNAYRASKTLAERAAWAWLEENTKDGVAPFDLATINPPMIYGPAIHAVPSAKALNTSVAAWYAYLNGGKKDVDATAASGSFVDVRDVAHLHIEALVTPAASNLRFAVTNAPFSYQPFLDILHAPENAALLAEFPNAVRGVVGSPAPVQNLFDNSRARKVFNWTPIPMEKTVIDMTKSLAEKQKTW